MKLKPAEVRSFIASPPAKVAAVLIYGPDSGLVRERGEALVRKIAGSLDDPFRVSDLSATQIKDDPASLVDETFALSMAGGRRAIRARNVSDTHSSAFENLFQALEGRKADEGGFVVVEGGDLGSRSSLRLLFEEATNAAAIACYLDSPEELEALVQSSLREKKLAIDDDALSYFVERLGEDRGASRSEIDKLALYGEGAQRITLADVVALAGSGGTVGFDDAALAAATGDAPALDRALTLLYDEGTAPVAVLRGAQRLFQRLHLAAGKVAGGMDVESSLKTLRPPVFFKEMPRWRSAIQAWAPKRIADAQEILLKAEADCKTTGLPASPIAARALLSIAAAARASRRR
jgi:DNA polymerase III subunit delta